MDMIFGILFGAIIIILAFNAAAGPLFAWMGYMQFGRRDEHPKRTWWLFAVGMEGISIGGICVCAALLFNSVGSPRILSVADPRFTSMLWSGYGLLLMGVLIVVPWAILFGRRHAMARRTA